MLIRHAGREPSIRLVERCEVCVITHQTRTRQLEPLVLSTVDQSVAVPSLGILQLHISLFSSCVYSVVSLSNHIHDILVLCDCSYSSIMSSSLLCCCQTIVWLPVVRYHSRYACLRPSMGCRAVSRVLGVGVNRHLRHRIDAGLE